MLIELKRITELTTEFPTEEACIDHLEVIRWGGNVVSPFDPASKVYKCKGNKYKCKNTGRYFNVRTATIFEDSKIPLQKWFMAVYLLTSPQNQLSSYQLSRELGITQKSAWFVLHRLRYALDHARFNKTIGSAE